MTTSWKALQTNGQWTSKATENLCIRIWFLHVCECVFSTGNIALLIFVQVTSSQSCAASRLEFTRTDKENFFNASIWEKMEYGCRHPFKTNILIFIVFGAYLLMKLMFFFWIYCVFYEATFFFIPFLIACNIARMYYIFGSIVFGRSYLIHRELNIM